MMTEPKHLSTENLIAICESLCVRGSWKVAAQSLKSGPMAESTCYLWLTRSKRAQREGDTSSPFLFQWRDDTRWFHEHCRRARSEQILSLEGLIRDQVREGIEEVMYDPSTNRPLLALNPRYIGMSDDEIRASDFPEPDLAERYLWNRDAAGNRTTPIFQTRTVQIPASLKQAALRAVIPAYQDNASLTINHKGRVDGVLRVAPPEYQFKSEANRQKYAPHQPPIVDASFTEVPTPALPAPEPVHERADIAALRQQVEALKGNPDRVTRPDRPIPVGGRRSPDDPPERVGAFPAEAPVQSQPRAPQPQPQQSTPEPALPPYVRRDPRRALDANGRPLSWPQKGDYAMKVG
jgi:hypothetical protein